MYQSITLKERSTKKMMVLCAFLFCSFFTLTGNDQSDKVTLTVAVHGVDQFELSVIPTFGKSMNKPLKVITQESEQPITVEIDRQYCPGEFSLRFNFYDDHNQPIRKERNIFINNQDISLNINPWFINNNDSTFFLAGGEENEMYDRFEMQSQKNKDAINLLLAVLIKYDNNKSSFYKQAIYEYRQRVKTHNEWVRNMIDKNKSLFVSHLFQFYQITEIENYRDDEARKKQQRDQYLSVFDFQDDLVLRTSVFRNWLDNYVSSYLERDQTKSERDIALVKAGQLALTKAQHGHGRVFGWMVDYFFDGYESMNVPDGIKMLGQYINDPNCLSLRKLQIETRIQGINTLGVSMLAPDITIVDSKGKKFQFQDYQTAKPYKMLLFWSADCEHCIELIGRFYPWYMETPAKEFFDVIAISLDDTETEIPKWEQMIAMLPQWVHSRAQGGLGSKQAEKYYVVSTPVMIFVDSRTNQIIAIPDNPGEIIPYLK